MTAPFFARTDMRLQCRHEGYRSNLGETSNKAHEKLHEKMPPSSRHRHETITNAYKFEAAIESVDDDASKDEDVDKNDDEDENDDEDAVDDKGDDDEDGDTDEAEAEDEDEDEDEDEIEDACALFFARFGLRAS
jgi:hypothetical protein